MKIYLIQHQKYDWDANMGHVIVANNEIEVIKMASKVSADEGIEIWSSKKCSISVLGEYTGEQKESFIVLTDFNAG